MQKARGDLDGRVRLQRSLIVTTPRIARLRREINSLPHVDHLAGSGRVLSPDTIVELGSRLRIGSKRSRPRPEVGS